MKYILHVETDDDFALGFKGGIYGSHEFTLVLDSVDELDGIKVLGPFGSAHTERTKDWEWKQAVEAIKKSPDDYFSSLGGNRGVEWTPTTRDMVTCPQCGHIL